MNKKLRKKKKEKNASILSQELIAFYFSSVSKHTLLCLCGPKAYTVCFFENKFITF